MARIRNVSVEDTVVEFIGKLVAGRFVGKFGKWREKGGVKFVRCQLGHTVFQVECGEAHFHAVDALFGYYRLTDEGKKQVIAFCPECADRLRQFGVQKLEPFKPLYIRHIARPNKSRRRESPDTSTSTSMSALPPGVKPRRRPRRKLNRLSGFIGGDD